MRIVHWPAEQNLFYSSNISDARKKPPAPDAKKSALLFVTKS